jgi:multidrug efflux system outer membrane protein
MSARRILILISATALLTGCALQAAVPARPDIPAAFDNVRASAGQWPAQQWYRDFGSDELDGFIDLAAKSNLDLASARARQASAAILPSVDTSTRCRV